MKHLLSLLSALIIFSFASCENNKVPLTKENLVGTWNVVEITNQNSDKFHKVGGPTNDSYTFKSDNTYSKKVGKQKQFGMWTLKENVLNIDESAMTVTDFNAKVMIWKYNSVKPTGNTYMKIKLAKQ